MASINDILTAEAKTDHSVRLYRDGGLFIRAYERSAYLFVHHVRAYQVQRKYYKVCNHDVVSLGFPQSALPSLGCQYIENADGTLSIPVEAEIDEQQFLQWKAQVPTAQKKPDLTPPLPVTEKTLPATPAPDRGGAEVLRELKGYNLADSTPMQAMLFLQELQRKLKEKDNLL